MDEARRAVRKTEKWYHGVPTETTFDQHLREAKRAKHIYPEGEAHSGTTGDIIFSIEYEAIIFNIKMKRQSERNGCLVKM